MKLGHNNLIITSLTLVALLFFGAGTFKTAFGDSAITVMQSTNAYTTQAGVNSSVSIVSNVYNWENNSQSVTAVTQIVDSAGLTRFLNVTSLELDAGAIIRMNVTWIADSPGNYTATTFFVLDWSSPQVFSAKQSQEIAVTENNLQQQVTVNESQYQPFQQTLQLNGTSPEIHGGTVPENSTSGAPSAPPVTISEVHQYVLDKINQARQKANLTDVRLSPNQAAQFAADDMLTTRAPSHWTTQGEKPYITYTRLGGTGAVQQNIALTGTHEYYLQCVSEIPCPPIDPYATIDGQLDQMLSNNMVCCNNTEHDNILSPFHTDVSIGIAYDNHTLALVQNFENNYLSLNAPITTDNKTFEFSGNNSAGTLVDIRIGYDPAPNSTSYDQHKVDLGYNSGDFVAEVVPPPPSLPSPAQIDQNSSNTTSNDTIATLFNVTDSSNSTAPADQSATMSQPASNATSSGQANQTTSSYSIQSATQGSVNPVAGTTANNSTITASKWIVNGPSFDIAFDMSQVYTKVGVYTIYVVLQDESGNKFNATSNSVAFNG